MSITAYRIIGTLAWPFFSAYFAYRLLKGKEDRLRFKERFGIAEKVRPKGDLVWFHAASIGESLSLLPLIRMLHEVYPQFIILITTGTVSSAKILDENLPSYALHQYVPVDRYSYVRRFLNHWRPDLAFWSESEFWPNLLSEIAKDNIPLILIQGRVSPKSFKQWQILPGFISQILKTFSFCLAQTSSDADRLKSLGATNVKYAGNLKSAALPLSFSGEELNKISAKLDGRSLWLAASTHSGEEELIWGVHLEVSKQIPDLLTIIAPRHVDRGNSIAAKLSALGATVSVRSKGEEINEKTEVYLADTIGELGLFYRLVNIVFIGKSLVDLGGQNLIEPAQLSNAIMHGPYMWNFSEIVRSMAKKNAAIQVNDTNELIQRLTELSKDKNLRKLHSDLALEFVDSESNVIHQIFAELTPFFNKIEGAKIFE